MQTNFLKVTNRSEVKQDKNGRNYVTISLQGSGVEFVQLPTGKVVSARVEVRPAIGRNGYEQSYLNDQPDFLWSCQKGEDVAGAIVTRNVAPYEIPERIKGVETGKMITVTSYTTVVLGNTADDSFETKVAQTFARENHPLNTVVNTPVEVAAENPMKG